jgi:hypothetical protein
MDRAIEYLVQHEQPATCTGAIPDVSAKWQARLRVSMRFNSPQFLLNLGRFLQDPLGLVSFGTNFGMAIAKNTGNAFKSFTGRLIRTTTISKK